ncbi:hypothetical protein FRC11_014779 [Ceratobasidium sp. 423]|nr:hypothetical protein FRC11_014779 [Ceratobasidium sp. 423]
MALPEKDNVVTRLLQHKDPQTVIVTLVFIFNSLSTSPNQSLAMAKGEGGRAISCSLLEMVDRTYEDEQKEHMFQYIFSIFIKLFENGALATLYKRLQPADGTVSPHQITLLKVLDGYTHTDPKTFDENPSISAFLSDTLSTLLQTTKSCVTVDPNSEIEFIPDENLPQVSAATVLVSQALSNALMAEQTAWEMSNDKETPGRPVLNNLRDPSSSFVELVIDVLRRLDQLLPRIQFGKAKPVVTGTETPSNQASLPASRFQFQKRDLLRNDHSVPKNGERVIILLPVATNELAIVVQSNWLGPAPATPVHVFMHGRSIIEMDSMTSSSTGLFDLPGSENVVTTISGKPDTGIRLVEPVQGAYQ